MALLDLVPIYLVDRGELFDRLTRGLERTFGMEVRTRPPWFDPELAFDTSRGQYNSTLFLKQLLSVHHEAESRVLGVTGTDLFVPVLTYVFGEAQLDGQAAVVSVHRLRPENYGLPTDPVLLGDRLIKEATHELGHTYGLIHCGDSDCVMHPSTYVEEIDLKSETLCADCSTAVHATA
jgi:archaemetzincin